MLGPDPGIGCPVADECGVARRGGLLRRLPFVRRGCADPAPDLVRILEVNLQVRVEARVIDAADGVTVLDQVGQLGHVVVGGRAGDVDPHIGVGRIGQCDHVLPRLAVVPEVRIPLGVGGREPPLRPLERLEEPIGAVRRPVVVRVVDVQVPQGPERLQSREIFVGKKLGRVRGVAWPDQLDISYPRTRGTGRVDGIGEVDHHFRVSPGVHDHLRGRGVRGGVVDLILDGEDVIPADRGDGGLALERE